MDAYEQLGSTLARDGIRCFFQSPHQLAVSRQLGAVWPDRGNSFWVTHATGSWHLFTWGVIGYFVPESADIASLCQACMAYDAGAMYQVPSEVVQEFGLRELSDDEERAVISRMEKTA